MAQKRMVDKKISVSEQVANLERDAQLIFTWSIPHADDIGMLPSSMRTLKAVIIPMIDMSLEEFGNHWESIVRQNLIEPFHYKGKKFYRVCTFLQNQTLKRDRQPMTILPFDLEEKPKDSWVNILKLDGIDADGIQMEDDGFHLEPEEKRREEKRSKDIYTSEFEKFWKIYPKKVGKSKTFELWKKLTPQDKKLAMSDIPERMKDEKWVGGFIKDPERYIKSRQWEDEIRVKSSKVTSDKF